MVEEKKTAIWNGGLDALLAGDTSQGAAPVEEVPAVALSSQTNDRSGTRIMGSWLAPVVEEAAAKLNADQQPITRVLPIEDLYPAIAAAERATATATATTTLAPSIEQSATTFVVAMPKVEAPRKAKQVEPALLAKLRALATGPERERFFLYGGLGAFLLVMGTLMGVRTIMMRAGGAPPSPVVQTEAARPAPSPVTAPVTHESAVNHAPAGASGIAPAGLERAAVDALARGDYAQAQRLYQSLSKAQPGRSEFHEAARILARAGDESGRVRTGN